ncbi:MAG: hypothetical protein BWX50_01433 [Euryarchaeota archaeon ADurb.Bin009]|nr:MAG: hypothetical protein BWX50_01433 [Euryarchaeota archaeon ADurb.Bin009]
MPEEPLKQPRAGRGRPEEVLLLRDPGRAREREPVGLFPAGGLDLPEGVREAGFGDRAVSVPPPAGVEPAGDPVDQVPPLLCGQVGIGRGQRRKTEDLLHGEPERAVGVGIERRCREDGLFAESAGDRRVIPDQAVVGGVVAAFPVVVLDIEPANGLAYRKPRGICRLSPGEKGAGPPGSREPRVRKVAIPPRLRGKGFPDGVYEPGADKGRAVVGRGVTDVDPGLGGKKRRDEVVAFLAEDVVF